MIRQNDHQIAVAGPPVRLVPVTTTTGVMLWIAQDAAHAIQKAGGAELRIRIGLDPSEEWLSVTEAAQEHVADIDGLGLPTAKATVSRAAARGDFKSAGRGHTRRIEPSSFREWRLRRREKALDNGSSS